MWELACLRYRHLGVAVAPRHCYRRQASSHMGSELGMKSRPDHFTANQPSSLLFSSSFTCCGLALPLEAFIAWPTKKPNILPRLASSAARYCSTCSALA